MATKFLSLAHKQARDVLDYDRDMNQARYLNNRKAARLNDESYRQPTKFEQSVAMKINIYFNEMIKAIDIATISEDPRSLRSVINAYIELVQKLREYKAQSTFEQRDISEIEDRFDGMRSPLQQLRFHAAVLNWRGADVLDLRHMMELISDRIYIPMKDDPDIVGLDQMPNMNRRADFKFADRVQPATAAEINAAIATLNPATAAAAAAPAAAAPAAAAPATPAAAAPATPAAAAPATPKTKLTDRDVLYHRYTQAGGSTYNKNDFLDANNNVDNLRGLIAITKHFIDQNKPVPVIDLGKTTKEEYRKSFGIKKENYTELNKWTDEDAAPSLFLGPAPPTTAPGSTQAQTQGTSNLSLTAASGNGKHTKTGGFDFMNLLGNMAKQTIESKIKKMYGGYSAAEGEKGMRQGQSEGFIRGLSSKKMSYNAADGLTRVERRHKEVDWKGFKQMLKERKNTMKRGDEPSYEDRTRFLFQHEVDESPEGELTSAATPAKVKSLIMKDLKK